MEEETRGVRGSAKWKFYRQVLSFGLVRFGRTIQTGWAFSSKDLTTNFYFQLN